MDVTVTATMRPDLLNTTFTSFFRYALSTYVNEGCTLNLIINVDNVGDGTKQEMVDCLRGRFHTLCVHPSPVPSFPRAFKYVWSKITSDYVLHLEDDWKLLRKVSIQGLIDILKDEEDLALLRLPLFPSGVDNMKNWNIFFPYNGRYYECPKELRGAVGFCGHPSVIKGDFIRSITPLLSDTTNPEKQFHVQNSVIMSEVLKWRYGVYGVPGSTPLIQDIGRKWMVENNYAKEGNKAFFTNWTKTTKLEV